MCYEFNLKFRDNHISVVFESGNMEIVYYGKHATVFIRMNPAQTRALIKLAEKYLPEIEANNRAGEDCKLYNQNKGLYNYINE